MRWTEVTTLGDLLVRGAALHPDRDALVMPEERITYAELLAGALRVARSLHALGVERGQNVGLLMHNSRAFVEAFFGTALLGAVNVPLHARYKAAELNYVVSNADLVVVLAHSTFADVVREATRGTGVRHQVLMAGEPAQGFLSPAEFLAAADSVAEQVIAHARQSVRVRETALIIYTSGTTASPKGCMLSHEAITRGPSERARERLTSGGPEVTWAAGPLFHIGSLGPFIGSMAVMGTFLCDKFFDAPRALRLMEENRVTVAWPWFSAIVQALLDAPGFRGEQLRSLRYLFIIASPTLVSRVISTLPWAEVLQACGMTETAGVFALSDRDESASTRAVTQGKAWLGVDIRIREPDSGRNSHSEAKVGEVGEILVRGPCVMSGYFRDPKKTAEALDAQGWLHTGDLYARQADGSLVFNGRLKDMLKVGGENVAALEVESVLCAHPAVRLAEVVGRADPRLDEVPVAFVELKAEASAEELIEFCRDRLARFKVPRSVFFVQSNEWPMSATKVDKRALRARLG